jgi:D-3-phosphoglycerate dehydrogenase
VGYGNIGKQLSVLAEAMGMHVYFYDVNDQLSIGNATKIDSLETLLGMSDVVSLHVDDNKANKDFFDSNAFAAMKPGSLFVNLSRGFVVNIEALVAALESGHIAGAAIDVYPEEPISNGPFITALQGMENVILTPHIGGSTEEAQRDIASFVPNKIMEYINSGNTVDAVNFPNIRLPKQLNSHRFLHIHKNVPGVMAKINEVLASYELNITGQFLSTDPEVGYVISDVNKEYNKEVIQELKNIPNTIKFRVLY